MRHRPVEIVRLILPDGQTFANARNGRVRNRLVQKENEALMRMPLRWKISKVNLKSMEDDGVAFVQQIAIGCGDAIGELAAVVSENFATESHSEV